MDESLPTNLGLEDLRWLHRLARQLVQNPDDADDAVQDTVLAALTRAPRNVNAPRGWLAKVLHNVVRQDRRGALRRAAREGESGVRDQTRGAAEVVEELAWHRTLVDQVNALAEPYRSTIVLRFLRGRSPRAIAREQEIPVKTVHTRIERGLGQLREALDRGQGGDRSAWMSAVTAIVAPKGGGVATGTLVIGGMAMGTIMKVSAAVLVAAACVYFATRTLRTELPRMEVVETPAAVERMPADVELADTATLSLAVDPGAEAEGRSPVAEEPTVSVTAAERANVLRVVLEGINAEDARMATVTVMGLDERDGWPVEIGASWPSQGLTSEFDLDPVFASVERHGKLRAGALEVAVEHPHHLGGRAGISLARGVELANGKTVHEVRMQLVRPQYWPEFTLIVRDAHTRAHLKDVELRIRSGPGASFWGRNNPSTLFDDGLNSPIALMGGREPDEALATVAGLALSPAAGESPRLVELARRQPPERGVIVSARAPGYAWNSTSIDVSKGERELLLEPAATLEVRLTNMQLERYAALGTVPMLCVYRLYPNGGVSYVHFEPLVETLETEGLRLESLVPAGNYAVAVELGGGSWTEQPVLALEELSLAAGETRKLVLVLDNPPARPERASLGGVISFPDFGGEEKVRLQLYFQPTQKWRKPDFEFSLADLQRVGGALPTWVFSVDDLPVGMYRVQLMPFLKVWMIELPASGAEDLELVLPELAEVLVETVDGRTGERVSRSELYYRFREPVPGQQQRDLAKADTEEPGRFRFWAAPGAVMVWPKFPNGAEREYGGNGMDLELVPGIQSVKFEFAPVYAMRFEFREDGTALPTGPQGLDTIQDIRAVDHDGRVTDGGLQRDMVVEVSAPGLYEISFDGIDKDSYHPLPTRLVNVRADETTEVIVELHRK